MQYTPEKITSLEPNQIFVFGSNTEGKHGSGAAYWAMKFGAKYGQAEGLQGQTYAIVTKDLRLGLRSIPLEYIKVDVENLYKVAKMCPEKTFLVTKIGTDLAGYSVSDIANIFIGLEDTRPKNVILPKEFTND